MNELINLNKYSKILIISGAGVSTSSDLKDYKTIQQDNFKGYKYSEIMSLDFFKNKRKRRIFYEYINNMRINYQNKAPSSGHLFANNLLKRNKLQGVITQNIDNLYDSVIPKENIIKIHGDISQNICLKCGLSFDTKNIIFSKNNNEMSPCCNFLSKPNITLFSEIYDPEKLKTINEWFLLSDCLIVMGTRLNIDYIKQLVLNFQGDTILINDTDIDIYKKYNSVYGESYEKFEFTHKYILTI